MKFQRSPFPGKHGPEIPRESSYAEAVPEVLGDGILIFGECKKQWMWSCKISVNFS